MGPKPGCPVAGVCLKAWWQLSVQASTPHLRDSVPLNVSIGVNGAESGMRTSGKPQDKECSLALGGLGLVLRCWEDLAQGLLVKMGPGRWVPQPPEGSRPCCGSPRHQPSPAAASPLPWVRVLAPLM